jgi:hypothetical protein
MERVGPDPALDPLGAQLCHDVVPAVDLDHVGLQAVAITGIRLGPSDGAALAGRDDLPRVERKATQFAERAAGQGRRA